MKYKLSNSIYFLLVFLLIFPMRVAVDYFQLQEGRTFNLPADPVLEKNGVLFLGRSQLAHSISAKFFEVYLKSNNKNLPVNFIYFPSR